MKYETTVPAVFLDRPNRFIAHVRLGDCVETVHVKNTGRCKELLVPGAEVILERSSNPSRKTKYDIICVNKSGRLINMDSQIPNRAAEEWLKSGGLFPEEIEVFREKTYGNSRFDLYVESKQRKAFIEVKGVTLEKDNVARFPDAPTLRGIKHMEELIRCQQDGYEAYLLFVIQMKGIVRFEPNWETHREFGETLVRAANAGVHILARDCAVTEDSIECVLSQIGRLTGSLARLWCVQQMPEFISWHGTALSRKTPLSCRMWCLFIWKGRVYEKRVCKAASCMVPRE